jgi:hypothetical protein
MALGFVLGPLFFKTIYMTVTQARNLTLATAQKERERIDVLIRKEAEAGFFELVLEESFKPPVISYYKSMGFKVETRMKKTIINWE